MATIAILERNKRRRTVFERLAVSRLAAYDVQIFSSPRDIQAWLRTIPKEIVFLSLDSMLDRVTKLPDGLCGADDTMLFLLDHPISGAIISFHNTNPNSQSGDILHRFIDVGFRGGVVCQLQHNWAASTLTLASLE